MNKRSQWPHQIVLDLRVLTLRRLYQGPETDDSEKYVQIGIAQFRLIWFLQKPALLYQGDLLLSAIHDGTENCTAK